MKIKLELFGASRDFSNKEFLEFNIKQKMEIKDFRKEVINYLDKKLSKLPINFFILSSIAGFFSSAS